MKFSTQRRSGSALIVVLWAVVLLAFAVAIASEKVGLVLGDASIRAKRVQAELLSRSAYASLEKILKDERKHNLESERNKKDQKRRLDLNRFQGTWRSDPVEFEGGVFWLEIEDEQSRIHWLKTPFYVWRNLLRTAGLRAEQIDAWADCLADWQDADDSRGLNGAESFDYLALKENRRRAKNAPIMDMGEIYWVMGGADLFDLQVPVESGQDGARPLLPYTTLDGDGKININTAPAFLIAAALDIQLEDAEQVVRKRWGPDGVPGTADDVFLESAPTGQNVIQSAPPASTGTSTNAPSPSTAITTSSNYFRVRGVGVFQEQRVVCEALAKKGGDEGLTLLRLPRVVERKRDRPDENQK